MSTLAVNELSQGCSLLVLETDLELAGGAKASGRSSK